MPCSFTHVLISEVKEMNLMKSAWIWRIIYILFIGALTFVIASFSEASKVVNFLEDNRNELMADDHKMIVATSIANLHDKSDAYVLKTPLYEQTFELPDFKLKLSIYPFVTFNKDKVSNQLAFLVTDLSVSDTLASKDDNDDHLVYTEFVFDRELDVENQNKQVFMELMTPLYDDTGRMIIINQDLLKTPSGQAQFQTISIAYELSSGQKQTLVVLANSLLIENKPSDMFDVSIPRDIAVLSETNLDFANQYGTLNLENEPAIYYDSIWLERLDSYQSIYVRNILIELAIILPVTYFLFFHKHVLRHIKQKKKE